jgi:hypothetical protein
VKAIMDNSEKHSEYRVEDIVVSERTGFTMGSSNEAVTLEYEAETLDSRLDLIYQEAI